MKTYKAFILESIDTKAKKLAKEAQAKWGSGAVAKLKAKDVGELSDVSWNQDNDFYKVLRKAIEVLGG